MSWPTPQDYNEAIQNPRLCFEDADLKQGNPELNGIGLPRPITGGFASVYRITSNNRDWAVRCFLRNMADQQQRYEAISKALSAAKLPYTVGFQFIQRGIKIKGQWFPILKMEWVKGDLLNDYIQKNLTNSQALRNLANRWVTMIQTLQAASISHGDLQHGNVLVVNDELCLIDYDGMYVSALSGQQSNEVGHRNYQHPLRSIFDFGPYLDNFAAWVIYVSILILSIDQTLWKKTGAGDEYLLFRKEDFENPATSGTFTLLKRHSDLHIQGLTSVFEPLVYHRPQDIPTLDGKTVISPQPNNSTTSAPKPAIKGVSWIDDHIKQEQNAKSSQGTDNLIPTENAAWLFDFLPSSNSAAKCFTRPTRTRIEVLLTALSLCPVIFIFGLAFQPVSVVLAEAVIGFLFSALLSSILYSIQPVIIEKRKVIAKVEEKQKNFNELDSLIKTASNKKEALLKRAEGDKKKLEKSLSSAQEDERKQIKRISDNLTKKMNTLNARRHSSNQNLQDALRKIANNNNLPNLTSQLAKLQSEESVEINNELLVEQRQYVTNYLKQYSIRAANISGVGEKLKDRLRAAGIQNAADAEDWRVRRVSGIGEVKARAISSWRQTYANKARLSMPHSLSTARMQQIQSKFAARKAQLVQQQNAAILACQNEEKRIKDQYAQALKMIDADIAKAQAEARQENSAISNKFAQTYAQIRQNIAQIEADAKKQTKHLENEIDQLRKDSFSRNWQLLSARKELATYNHLKFKDWVIFLLLNKS